MWKKIFLFFLVFLSFLIYFLFSPFPLNSSSSSISLLPKELRPATPLLFQLINNHFIQNPQELEDIASLNDISKILKGNENIYIDLVNNSPNKTFAIEDHMVFVDALTHLLESLKNDAKLHPLGRIMMHGMIADQASVKLDLMKIKNMLFTNADNNLNHDNDDLNLKEKSEIKNPVFITGVPRAGTTFFQRLLSVDTRFRSPYAFESQQVLPLLLENNIWTKLNLFYRIAKSGLITTFINLFTPGISAIHDIGPLQHEECIVLLQPTMISSSYNTLAFLKKYQDWWLEQNPIYALHWHHMILRALQLSLDFDTIFDSSSTTTTTPTNADNIIEKRRWLLKAPQHTYYIDKIFEEYPDAKIIFPHRSFNQVMPSLCSLITRLRGVFSDNLNVTEICDDTMKFYDSVIGGYLRVTKNMSHKNDEFLSKRILDINFKDFQDGTDQTIVTLRKIYDFLDMTFPSEVEADFRHFLDTNKILGTNRAKHVPDPAWFGLENGIDPLKYPNMHLYNQLLSSLQ